MRFCFVVLAAVLGLHPATAQVFPQIINNPQVTIDQLYETGIAQIAAVPTRYTTSPDKEQWMVDGYRGYCNNGAGVYTMARAIGVSPPGFDAALSLQVSIPTASTPAGANCHVELWLPPADIARFAMGTTAARGFKLSFYQACPGTSIDQSIGITSARTDARSFVGLVHYTNNNEFQRLYIDVPADTSSNALEWSAGLKILIDQGFGSNFEIATPSTAWQNGLSARITGSFNFIAQPAGTNCFFTGFQIDPPSAGDPPAYRIIASDAALKFAQRFICKTAPQGVAPGSAQGWSGSLRYTTQQAGAHGYNIDFDNCGVDMNAMPVATLFNPRAGGTAGAWGSLSASLDSALAESPAFANTKNRSLLWNNGAATDGNGQINAIEVLLMACPGNESVGTGCQEFTGITPWYPFQ